MPTVPVHAPISEALPEIPAGAYDRFGKYVNLDQDKIHLHDPVEKSTLDLLLLPDGHMRYAMKLRVAFAVGAYAPTSVQSEFKDIISCLSLGGMPRTLEEMDINWWRSLREALRKDSCEWRLHRLRYWFLWLDDQGFPGLDLEAVDIVETWSISGNVKGEAVRSRDPDEGPLTWGQFAHLVARLRNEASKAVIADNAAVQLCVNWGLNARHLALLEERDLSYLTDPSSGEKEYFLEVPRIKKRSDRRETKRRHLQPETGIILEKLIHQNRINRGEVHWEQSGKMPIFSRAVPQSFATASPLSQRFEWHCSPSMISAMVRRFSSTYELVAGGSNERFSLSPRRLRYTFATMLAATGAPPVAIAEALDHTDLQNVGVYTLATGKLADRLNDAIGKHIEPWVTKFMAGPPSSIPAGRADIVYHPDPTKALGIGYCGLSTRCHLFPPDTCYGCDFFQPWVDADHESVLKRLEERRAKRFEERGRASDRIPHQLDSVIESVKLVVAAQAVAKGRTQ